MTDNEIIKALELCMDEDDRCGECPYEGSPERCVKVHGKDLLDLINRQKEKLEISKTKLFEQQLKKELHRLTVEEIKAEAIKDFAERLCEDRVTNDPVVIAVKTEMKFMIGE